MPESDSGSPAAWPLVKRILFRLAAAFFILVSFPFPKFLTNRGFHWINEYPFNR
jgi:hypothetical protein